MRILTLVTGPEAAPDATRLAAEIVAFNREIDFRLRFLHIDIEVAFIAAPGVFETDGGKVHTLEAQEPLDAAAELALLIDHERPALVVVTGDGPLREAGLASARAASARMALFGVRCGHAEGAMRLGEDARLAVETITGVARELH